MPLTAYDNSDLTTTEIRAIQSRLHKIGFDPGPIDGLYGPHTASAIIAFKRSAGLRIREYVGPKTWELLHQAELDLGTELRTEELPWMKEIRKVMNMHEVYDNAGLRRWLASDGHALGDPAQFPWCGDAVETAIRLALPEEPVPVNPYWALNWKKWGCVISISRNGGGHVAFLVGQDRSRYYCLGGNQSNQVRVSPISKSRFDPDSFRWPSTYEREPVNLPWMTSQEAASQNEA
jgi:catechol 2,3-dioxygenase-like lactoylglutathione lyase family enzyme